MSALLWLLACGAPAADPVPPPAPPGPTAEEQALARAEALATEAATRLKDRMLQEMGRHGPGEAVTTCSLEAEALTTASADPGARVGRASLRLRNPQNAPPDWVAAWLTAQGERPAEGVQGFSRIDQTPEGPRARVLRPIVTAEPCLACHGAGEALPAEVRAVIEQRYPDDRATGYAAGDLRGALWAEIPVGS